MLSHALLHFPYWGMAGLLALPASVYHTQQNGPCFISLCFSALNYWLSESRLLWTWPFQFGGRETLFHSLKPRPASMTESARSVVWEVIRYLHLIKQKLISLVLMDLCICALIRSSKGRVSGTPNSLTLS